MMFRSYSSHSSFHIPVLPEIFLLDQSFLTYSFILDFNMVTFLHANLMGLLSSESRDAELCVSWLNYEYFSTNFSVIFFISISRESISSLYIILRFVEVIFHFDLILFSDILPLFLLNVFL